MTASKQSQDGTNFILTVLGRGHQKPWLFKKKSTMALYIYNE